MSQNMIRTSANCLEIYTSPVTMKTREVSFYKQILLMIIEKHQPIRLHRNIGKV